MPIVSSKINNQKLISMPKITNFKSSLSTIPVIMELDYTTNEAIIQTCADELYKRPIYKRMIELNNPITNDIVIDVLVQNIKQKIENPPYETK